MKLFVRIYFWTVLYISEFYYGYGFTGEIFSYMLPSDCSAEEFYSVNTLYCQACPKDKNLIPSEDKYTCVCNNHSKLIKWDAEYPVCSQCKEKQEPTFDKSDCIQCPFISKSNNTVCSSNGISSCRSNEILVDRDIRGNILERKMCIPCTHGYMPHRNGPFCTPCSLPNCTCSNDTHELLSGELCVPRSELSSLPDEQNVYIVDFDSGHQVIKSHYLKTHLRTSLYRCTKLKRRQACQSVANMCVMLLYKDEQVGGPCRIFKDYRYVPSSAASVNHLPWLYYSEGDASILLNRKKIDMHYSLDPSNSESVLNFTVAKYSLEGKFLSLSAIKGNEIQLCPGISTYKDSAFRFGARYMHTCTLSASDFLNIVPQAVFYDLYLQYYDKSKSVLYPVPLVIRNISHNSEYPNKGPDVSQWLLVRRFFLLDNISGVAYSHEKYKVVSDLSPSVVRYLKSAKLVIKTRREKDEEGKIYPPFLMLEYGELTKEDIATDTPVQVSFAVDYYMDNDISHIIDVSIGVLSAGVVIWSGIQTWSYCRRSGQLIIDMSTLMELALRSCGYFSNMIFIVTSIVALHTLLFYKAQSVAYIMLPSESLENNIAKYIIIAFILKVVEIVRLIYMQMKIDIFLIDWERPRACGGITNLSETNHQQQPVSIWRTYFVANEWNEIQTKRKTSLLLQLMFTLLLLKVYGIENWAQADPDLHLQHIPYRPESLLLRFAVILTVYLFVYICQWLLVVGVYERYIKNCIQEFVDVCSMANVSVFILLQRNFGYYIHGRSAHGFADTDMQTILTQLRREEDDLVGHRGLLPGTEQQTFQIIIPTALRVYYNKVMSPLNLINRNQGGSSFRMKAINNDDAGRIVEAYNNMNKFLAAFLDHALKDLDYEVREKLFVEQLLDIEFHDSLDRGVFYIDNGHSFDGVLFYGNEGTLFTFDVMLFLCMDSFFKDTLLSAILCLFITQMITWIRNIGGRKNLAKKTLVDDRFLI